MLRVYVAGASREIERAESMIAALRASGRVWITHDWTVDVRENGPDAGCSPETLRRCAKHDLDGVCEADTVVVLVPDTSSQGVLVELGAALAFGCHVIAARSHAGVSAPMVLGLFGYLVRVQVDTDVAALSAVLERAR